MNAASEAMRVVAEHYLRLAEKTSDPQERQKYVIYAATYAEIIERSSLREIEVVATTRREEQKRRRETDLAPELKPGSHLRLVS